MLHVSYLELHDAKPPTLCVNTNRTPIVSGMIEVHDPTIRLLIFSGALPARQR